MDYDSFNNQLNVSRETYFSLKTYHDLLIKWQSSINLISPKTISEIWTRHILDSAQIYPLIDNNEAKIIDIGSGAGLPGVILSILGSRAVTLIESDSRKSIFLRETCKVLGLDTIVMNQRAEEVSIVADVVTSRACAPLNDLLMLSKGCLSSDTICYFPKGSKYAMEIEEAEQNWSFSYEIIPSLTNFSSAIVKMVNVKPVE